MQLSWVGSPSAWKKAFPHARTTVRRGSRVRRGRSMPQRPAAAPDLVGGLPRPKQVDAINSQCACVCSYCVCFCKKRVSRDSRWTSSLVWLSCCRTPQRSCMAALLVRGTGGAAGKASVARRTRPQECCAWSSERQSDRPGGRSEGACTTKQLAAATANLDEEVETQKHDHLAH